MVIVASSNDLVSFQLEFMQFLSEPIPQSTDFVVDHWPLASEPVSLFDRSPSAGHCCEPTLLYALSAVLLPPKRPLPPPVVLRAGALGQANQVVLKPTYSRFPIPNGYEVMYIDYDTIRSLPSQDILRIDPSRKGGHVLSR